MRKFIIFVIYALVLSVTLPFVFAGEGIKEKVISGGGKRSEIPVDKSNAVQKPGSETESGEAEESAKQANGESVGEQENTEGEGGVPVDSSAYELIELKLIESTPMWREVSKDTIGLRTVEESFESFREMGMDKLMVLDYIDEVFFREADVLEREMKIYELSYAVLIHSFDISMKELRGDQALTKEEKKQRLDGLKEEERQARNEYADFRKEYRKFLIQLEKDHNYAKNLVEKKY